MLPASTYQTNTYIVPLLLLLVLIHKPTVPQKPVSAHRIYPTPALALESWGNVMAAPTRPAQAIVRGRQHVPGSDIHQTQMRRQRSVHYSQALPNCASQYLTGQVVVTGLPARSCLASDPYRSNLSTSCPSKAKRTQSCSSTKCAPALPSFSLKLRS